MPLHLDPGEGEIIEVGHARLVIARRHGRMRLVIEGLSLHDVVRVCGVDVEMTKFTSARGKTKTRASFSGPRNIPIRQTGQLSDCNEDFEES